ncbi:hypothetical protein D7I47_02735 [Protaetiibacter intestinalis]|uniref:Uncharacterized protein n=2 Tax=Protaetiibacter intestinalis TaxID=2419774 RepID=A0A387B187_9MICO|nr:hypothetical protein D7I47_02735 [Protaetiibacter intestinalis]
MPRPAPVVAPKVHGHAARALVLGAAVAVAVGGFGAADAGADRLEPVAFTTPAAPAVATASTASDPVAALREATEAARTAHAAAAGHVLDESAREALAADIAAAEAGAERVRLLAALGGGVEGASDGGSAALVERLGQGVERLDAAVAAWEAEQARLAAEAAARAAQLAAQQAAGRTVAAGTGRVQAIGPYVESIWTTGGQAEVDACRGSVNFANIAAYLGGAFYAAEHWSCGGRAWSGLGTGARVDIPGYGSFQVAGRVGGLAYGSDASAVPAGYDGYYQTCVGGSASNMTVWLLTRVG